MFDVRKLLREPLMHFLLIGAALFIVFDLTREELEEAPNRILVEAGQVQQLAAKFHRTWLRPPTEKELAGLIENHVRDEVYYREAVAMGLDQNDAQVRQRMRLKLEFLLEDLSAGAAPDDATLAAYLQANSERFSLSPQVWFRHIYLNPDRRHDIAADAAALSTLLADGAAPETLGDTTMLPYEVSAAYSSGIARTFGTAFADQVIDLPAGNWSGPIDSGLGVHLVQVTERRPGRLPELAEIRAQVERDYLAQRRQQLKDQAYQKLVEGYEIVIEPVKVPDDTAGAAVAETQPLPSGG
jgi:hypothetical protein